MVVSGLKINSSWASQKLFLWIRSQFLSNSTQHRSRGWAIQRSKFRTISKKLLDRKNMISDRKQYIGIKNNIVFELFQFLFMLEWILACISRFSAHIPTSFSVFMPNICCLDKLDNKHYAYRLIMMWEYGQKNEKYWPGSIPAHIRIGKVLNVVIFDTNNCLLFWRTRIAKNCTQITSLQIKLCTIWGVRTYCSFQSNTAT